MKMLQQDSSTKDSLWASFEDKPASPAGQCPLQQPDIAIFPVRYAIDEAPENEQDQGPNPIPTSWQGHQSLPALKNRSYTLRQLRDGWLYVVNRASGTVDEYQVSGSGFSKISSSVSTDAGHASCGESASYLLYPRDCELYLAYSHVKWTPHTHEKMKQPENQARFMRALDLVGYARTLEAAHCAPLKQLAEAVADIDEGAATGGQRFDSTTTPSEPISAASAYKSSLGSDAVLGSVPDQDSAVFIALEDGLGVLDDLGMQAAGPAMALAEYEAEHMHRCTVAEYVETLAGADFAELESSMGLSPDAFYQFKQKAQAYLTAKAKNQEDQQRSGEFSDVSSFVELNSLSVELNSEYGEDIRLQLDALVEQWAAREELREQVRFEESQLFALEKNKQLQGLQAMLTPSLEDLIAWLEYLGADPLRIFHDQTDEDQCLALISNADTWLGLLTYDHEAQSWVVKNYATPISLLGLAHYNFDAELASGIEQLVLEFTEQDSVEIGTVGSVLKRTKEVISVLDEDVIRNSVIFQGLSRSAQNAYTTLLKVAAQSFEDIWEGFEYKLLPAVSSRLTPQWKMISYTAISLSIHNTMGSSKGSLILDSDYPEKHARWSREVQILNRQSNAQTGAASRGNTHDRRAADRHLQKLKGELDDLMIKMPNKIMVTEAAAETMHSEVQQRALLRQRSSMVSKEYMQQLILKAQDYGAYVKRANEWVKSNAVGGLTHVLTVLNIWNFHAAMTDLGAKGEWTQNDVLAVNVAAGYMLSGLTALTMMPAWAKISELTGEAVIRQNIVKGRLVDAAARYWEPSYSQYSNLFKTFAVRAITVSGLSVMASAAEVWRLGGDIDSAKSGDRALALRGKQVTTGFVGAVAGYQLYASIGAWFGRSAAGLFFAPWITIALAVLGVVYLIISSIADALKLEGIKLWLYRSSWSKSVAYWPETEEGNKDEFRALHEVLMRPTVLAQTEGGEVLLKLVFPPDLAGHVVDIYPMMVTEAGWFSEDRENTYRAGMYSGYLAEGQWTELDQLADWDSSGLRTGSMLPRPAYQTDDWRIWSVRLPHSKGMDRLDISIQYPPAILQRSDNRGYRVSVELDGLKAGTQHENPYIKGQVIEPKDEAETLVMDRVPPSQRSVFNLVVI